MLAAWCLSVSFAASIAAAIWNPLYRPPPARFCPPAACPPADLCPPA